MCIGMIMTRPFALHQMLNYVVMTLSLTLLFYEYVFMNMFNRYVDPLCQMLKCIFTSLSLTLSSYEYVYHVSFSMLNNVQLANE
jgi:hypothetical protein